MLKFLGKIIPFLLLAVMLFVGARFIVFKSVVKLQKHEFRQMILKQELKEIKQITIAAEDLYKDVNGIEWKESNKEVVIQNKFHEVLSLEKKGGFYVVNLIEDKEENELFRKFFDLQEEANEELPEDMLADLEMDFLLPNMQSAQFQNGKIIEHQTHYTSNGGTDVYSRTEKPPRRA